ncbi:MAG TPA: hypothetical protein VMW63_01440 [Methanoregulaceae archaeon]|nr:hypothetical protein [Methanoregulaceae archaeon]
MRCLVFFVIMTAALAAGAQGYILNIDAPEKVQAGVPLVVTGSTTFPAGTEFDLMFYKLNQPLPELVERRVVIIDESKEFIASLSTMGLESGQYKLEVAFPSDQGTKLGSGSTTLKILDIIDRSDELRITSPLEQTLTETLLVEGYIQDIGVATISMKVTGPGGFVVPVTNIRTTTIPGRIDGHFSKKIAVSDPGNYYVSFSDAKGFMTTVKFTVVMPARTTEMTITPSGEPTEEPTPTASPVPIAGLCGGLLGAAVLAYRIRK